jgi:pilus assembly protein CpaF
MAETNIFEATVRHFLAPVMRYMEDPSVSEIMINRADEIYIERAGKIEKTDAKFADDDALAAAVRNVLQYTGKRIDDRHPLIDSRLPDGSRVHVILAPLSRGGTCVTIRKFARVMFDAANLVKIGTWNERAMEYLKVCVLAEKNVLVGGGTSSGKTCLLNVLSGFIPHGQRIVVIEDSAELELQQEHLVGLETRPADRWGRGEVTISDLYKSSLRLRPDRVIIGEVRGGEALDMIQAMTSGHAGSMSTLHANTAADALNRLETLALMNEVSLPLYALRSQIASAIDVVVMMTRMTDGSRKVTQVAEVLPLGDDGHYRLRDMFRYRPPTVDRGEELVCTGERSSFSDEPKVRALAGECRLTRDVFLDEKDAS